jgi:hypothetical protein
VVLWEKLDRMTRYRLPDGRRSETQFGVLIDELRAHLAMTFQRFLMGEARYGRRLAIHLNGEQLTGWDPFARQEPATVVLPTQRLRLDHADAKHQLRVRPFVLPGEAHFSSAAAHRRAAGPRLWSRQQGFYFYRHDRLIQAGGWNRLRTQDEHTKLARIAVDLGTEADEAFELNVSKTQIRIPAPIRSDLAAVASAVCRIAEETYRRPRNRQEPLAEVAKDRASAVRKLVRMVLGTAENVVRAELSESPELGEHLIGRLGEMEARFVAELSRRAGG